MIKRIAQFLAVALVALAATLTFAPSAAQAEPKDPPKKTAFVVLMNSSVDVVKIDSGDVYRASVWRGKYSGATFYSVGRCLDAACEWIATALALNEETGTVYNPDGTVLAGLILQITRDQQGNVVGGQGGVDNVNFRMK